MKERYPTIWDLIRIKSRQIWLEKLQRGVNFRGDDPSSVAKAYGQMGETNFETVNAPQVWVNERQIPKAIRPRLPDGKALIVDIGMGPGTSTEILSYFCQPDWKIVAFDLSKPLVEQARKKAKQGFFKNHEGRTIHPEFVEQSATETFVFEDGQPIPDSSVSYVNSSGIVGHHLSEEDFRALVKELRRVVKPGAYAALDTGPRLGEKEILPVMQQAGFRLEEKVRSIPLDPRPQLVFKNAR